METIHDHVGILTNERPWQEEEGSAEQKKADKGPNPGTKQLAPPMIDITCVRQQQTGSKCKSKNLADHEK